MDLTETRALTDLGQQPFPHPDPYEHHPEARSFDFTRYALLALKWIRPLVGDSTPWSWRPERAPGITLDAMSRRIVYAMWIHECGWLDGHATLQRMQEGKMAEEVAKCSREPRFRSSSLRFLSPEDREKARALPNIPPAPESFKRCFLYFLEKGEVLAKAKAEPSE